MRQTFSTCESKAAITVTSVEGYYLKNEEKKTHSTTLTLFLVNEMVETGQRTRIQCERNHGKQVNGWM